MPLMSAEGRMRHCIDTGYRRRPVRQSSRRYPRHQWHRFLCSGEPGRDARIARGGWSRALPLATRSRACRVRGGVLVLYSGPHALIIRTAEHAKKSLGRGCTCLASGATRNRARRPCRSSSMSCRCRFPSPSIHAGVRYARSASSRFPPPCSSTRAAWCDAFTSGAMSRAALDSGVATILPLH